MDRKDFLKKGILGTGAAALVAAGAVAASETKSEQVGHNHLPNVNPMINTNMILHKADTRGKANHGWLNSFHSFSFANYYNPERMNFGALRVLNDDTILGGTGFGTHPHENMEIISIPTEGGLRHKDSMGNEQIINSGDIQVMSAGTGIYHSEMNAISDKPTKFFQIWVIPNKRGVTPRYDQITLNKAEKNKFQQVLSPNENDAGVWIHQDAWFDIGEFDQVTTLSHSLRKGKTHGVYAFVIEGKATIQGQELEHRDALGVWKIEKININAQPGARILLMEVPMTV
jgi:redox-sensitive bicupin YhaK (pirin superfamily)